VTVGVALMTYGVPTGSGDVAAYLGRVREGKTPSAELIEEAAPEVRTDRRIAARGDHARSGIVPGA
jgi:hypothetical protein